jgi:hypothetical protein
MAAFRKTAGATRKTPPGRKRSERCGSNRRKAVDDRLPRTLLLHHAVCRPSGVALDQVTRSRRTPGCDDTSTIPSDLLIGFRPASLTSGGRSRAAAPSARERTTVARYRSQPRVTQVVHIGLTSSNCFSRQPVFFGRELTAKLRLVRTSRPHFDFG